MSGYTYDDSVYEVTYVVYQDNDGNVVSERTITKDGEEVTAATFSFSNDFNADLVINGNDDAENSGNYSDDGSSSSGSSSSSTTSTTTSSSSSGNSSGSSNLPRTGDSVLPLVITLTVFCAGAITIAVALTRRRRSDRK
ncbi:MAG: hypothetical protein ACOYIK_03890 [Coriobacteriales bacterium]